MKLGSYLLHLQDLSMKVQSISTILKSLTCLHAVPPLIKLLMFSASLFHRVVITTTKTTSECESRVSQTY